MSSQEDEDAVKAVLIQRIEGIKNKDPQSIAEIVDKESYTKFDDWPPFKRQDLSALKQEEQGLKVLKEYDYETSDWEIRVFGNSALASFTIKYRGKIRNLEFNIHSRITAFLVKRESGWKLVHEHWSRFPNNKKVDLKDESREKILTPKSSLNLPPMAVFERLLDYFETPRFRGPEFSVTKKSPPSHIEGKWFIPAFLWRNWLGGNFKVDITSSNGKSKLKTNVNAEKLNILALGCFIVGLFLFGILPHVLWPFSLILFFATLLFPLGQWRKNNILREIDELFRNTLEDNHEKR